MVTIRGGAIFNSIENHKLEKTKIGIETVAEKYSCSLDQLLLAWVLKHPTKVCPVVGTSKIARIQSALEASKIELSKEDWYALLQIAWGKEIA